ncbi:MAG: hypothetical protein ACK56I_14085, partial [bacterium]
MAVQVHPVDHAGRRNSDEAVRRGLRLRMDRCGGLQPVPLAELIARLGHIQVAFVGPGGETLVERRGD